MSEPILIIAWEEPPPKHTKRGWDYHHWSEVIEELKKNPGVWACVRECKRMNASATAQRLRNQFHLEATARSTGKDDVYRVYARYLEGVS